MKDAILRIIINNLIIKIEYLAFKNMYTNDNKATIEFNFTLNFDKNSLKNYYGDKYLIQIGNQYVNTFEFFYSYFKTIE